MQHTIKIHLVMVSMLLQVTLWAQTPCVNGFAGPYPCQNVDLLFHADVEAMGGATTNEIWGWTDSLFQKDYVIVGLSTGVRFYDISNPVAPVYLGNLPTHSNNSIWRTFRHFNNYLYVGSEANAHGMQVFDLTRLRTVANPPEVFTEDAHYAGFGKCHTLSTLDGYPYVIGVGTNSFSGGLHVVDVSNPLAPLIAGGFAEDGYIHEIQLVLYDGPDQDYAGRYLAFCYSGNNPAALTVVDVTDPTDMSIVSSTLYPNPSYCHQGWLTEDKAYLLMDDELDEMNGLFQQTRTLIWDVRDLDNMQYMGDHLGTTAAIDHNQYIIGNLVYQSNYTAGLQILDVTNIADTSLMQVAFFDHYPASNGANFDGQWMNYPYFSSGVVPVTDIDNGFFLLQPNFIEMIDADTTCNQSSWNLQVNVLEGFPGPYEVDITGGPNGLTFDWQYTQNQIQIEAADWLGYTGEFDLTVRVIGAHHSYSRQVHLEVFAPLAQFLDADQDGFGAGEVQFACTVLPNYSLQNGDCDDSNATIYIGAPGTGDNIDNNCNAMIDPSESDFCADLTGDDRITLADVLLFTDLYGCAANCQGDLNNDGQVNTSDLLILIADYGEYCED